MATIIASAPLTQLENLEILDLESTSPMFFPTLFKKNWPALKGILIEQTVEGTIPLIASQSWVTNLIEIDLKNIESITTEDLQTFLKALEKGGVVEKLSLSHLESISVLEAFRGIKFEEAKVLSVENMLINEEEHGVDISDYPMDVFFTSCSFSELEEMTIGFNIDEVNENDEFESDIMPHWTQPPSTMVAPLEESFPLLKKIYFEGIYIARDVADYLGTFRRETGCKLFIDQGDILCDIEEKDPSPERRQFLSKLKIGYKDWVSYAYRHYFTDWLYWDISPEDTFKRIGYAAALNSYTSKMQNGSALQNFLNMIQVELDCSRNNRDGFETLKSYLELLLKDSETYSFLGSYQPKLRRNINRLIEYKERRVG